MTILGILLLAGGLLLLMALCSSLGVVVFMKMRTRDKLKVFFAVPFAAGISLILAIVGFTMMGGFDIPPGSEKWVFWLVIAFFAAGLVLGLLVRLKGGNSPAVLATETALMRRCPECAEQIQAAARVCRFCGARFDTGTPSAWRTGERDNSDSGDRTPTMIESGAERKAQ